ncbi:unnamed protein product, partial [Didymodactylos carnosus]
MTLECEYLEKMSDIKHKQNSETVISSSYQTYDTFNNETILTANTLVNTLEDIPSNGELIQTMLSTNDEDKQYIEDVYDHDNRAIVKDTIGLSITMALLKSHHKWTWKGVEDIIRLNKLINLDCPLQSRYKIEKHLDSVVNTNVSYETFYICDLCVDNISPAGCQICVRLFESRENSFVPMYLAINELPLKERFQPHNIILIGVWANEVYINRHLLQKVMEIICVQLLTVENGINVYVKDLDIIRNIAVYNIITVTDKVMKNKCMNMVQHNGAYGCAYCLNPRKHFKTVKGGRIRSFPRPHDYNYRLRSITTYNSAMAQLQQGIKLYQGHYGPCVLQSLKFHHFPNSFIVESMHTIYLGTQFQHFMQSRICLTLCLVAYILWIDL